MGKTNGWSGIMDIIKKAELWDYYKEFLESHGFAGITDAIAKFHNAEKERDEALAKLEDVSATIEGTVNLYKSLVKDLEEKLAAAEKQEPVKYNIEFFVAGERFCVASDSADFNSQFWEDEHGTEHRAVAAHPLYAKPVPADNPVVAVPDGLNKWYIDLTNSEQCYEDGEIIGRFCSNKMLRRLEEILAAVPSHSQQSAKRITECDARALCYAFLDYYDEEDDADFDTWLSSGGQALLDELNADRCPSHESEQHSFGKSEFIPVDLLLKPDLTDEDIENWRNQQTEG